jgi:hypothetical protein
MASNAPLSVAPLDAVERRQCLALAMPRPKTNIEGRAGIDGSGRPITPDRQPMKTADAAFPGGYGHPCANSLMKQMKSSIVRTGSVVLSSQLA